MDEEKRNKVKVAVVINVILLVFILVAVLIAQVVQISVLKRRKAELLNELKVLVEQVEDRQEFIDRYETDEAIRQHILELIKLGMTKEQIMEQLGLSDGDTLSILVVADPIA